MNNASLLDWARLVRLPTVFTVLADVGAAFLLVAHSPQPVPRFLCVLVAGVCLYWAGMILNDVFDIEVDRRERPLRPLPSGKISVSAARTAGWGLLVAGVLLATLSGLIPSEGVEQTWRPAVIGLLLAVAIVLYDGPLKRTPVAPLVMGLCRFFSFLLGASPMVIEELPAYGFQPHVWAAAAGFGIYVMGVTIMARQEAGDTQPWKLASGLAVLLAGCLVLALAPRWADLSADLRFSGEGTFLLLIGLLAITVLYRAARCFSDPRPERIQLTIKVALLTLIPLAAAFAMLGAGTFYGLAIFGLVFPATLLSARFRMT